MVSSEDFPSKAPNTKGTHEGACTKTRTKERKLLPEHSKRPEKNSEMSATMS